MRILTNQNLDINAAALTAWRMREIAPLFWRLVIRVLGFYIVGITTTFPIDAQAIDATANASAHGRYPPYPDVWHWQAPDPKAYVSGLRTYMLDNGDVLILFLERQKAVKRSGQTSELHRSPDGKTGDLSTRKTEESVADVVPRQVTFFGGQTVSDLKSNVQLIRNPGAPVRLNNGSQTHVLFSDWDKRDLKDGTYVLPLSYETKDCFVGPGKSYFNRYSSKNIEKGKVLQTKVIFRLLDSPEHWTGASDNFCNESDRKLTIRTKALFGNILPLDDGGFLLVDDEAGLVVRFASDFTTRTSLLNKQLFAFDSNDLLSGFLFMPIVNGKTYQTRKGAIAMQAVLNDLYSYLLRVRTGEK